MSDETLQEFAAAVEQLAHRALVGLPVGYIRTEAAHAFIDGIRAREVKQHLLMGGDRMLNEALNQALKLEAAKAAAWPTARLREVKYLLQGHLHHPSAAEMNDRYAGGADSPVTSKDTAGTARRDGPGSENEEGVSESSITPPRFTLKVLAEWAKRSLTADGRIQEKPCRITIDT
jgi:hypothetical protein